MTASATKNKAASPAHATSKAAALVTDPALEGFHAVRFIKEGLPASIERQLITSATAKGLVAVREADRRR